METVKRYHDLSHPQLRVYYSEMLNPGTNSQSLAISYVLREDYDLIRLTDAITFVIAQCDAFNTRLTLQESELKQCSYPSETGSIEYYDFTGNAQDFDKWLRQKVSKPINLSEGPLFHFCIYRNPQGSLCIFLNAHHIITDAFSWGLIIEQILYNINKLDRGEIPGYQLFPYSDYFKKESDYKDSTKFIEHRKYWTEKIRSRPLKNFFFGHSSIHSDHTSFRKSLPFDKQQTDRIRKFIHGQQTSPFRFFMGVTSVVMSKIFTKHELTFGTPFYNRPDTETRKMVGMMVNILPFYVDINEQLTFVGLLKNIKGELKSNLAHQNYPYDLLVQDVQDKNGPNASGELFDVVVNYQNYIYPKEVRSISWHHPGVNNYPLIVHISERGEDSNLLLEVDARKDYCKDEEIDLLSQLYNTAIKQVLDNPQKAIADIDLYTPQVVETFNKIKRPEAFGEHNHIWNYCSKYDKKLGANIDQQKTLLYHQKSQERAFWTDILSRHEFVFFGNQEQDSGTELKGKYNFTIHQEVSQKLIDISNKSDERLHIILSSCLLILFKNFLNKNQVALVTALFTKENAENLINNDLPVFCDFKKGDTFKDVLIRTIHALNKAITNQNYPIQYLIENDILRSKDKSNSVFGVRVLLKNIQNVSEDPLAKSQIAFLFQRDEESINAEIEFRTQTISEKEIEKIAANFSLISKALASDINGKIANVPLPYFNRYNFGIVGYDSLALSCAQLLLERNHEVSWVVSSPGSQLEKFAHSHNIKTLFANDSAALRLLNIEHLDYVIDLSDYSTTQVSLQIDTVKRIRYHDSLLEDGLRDYATSEAMLSKKNTHGMSWYVSTDVNTELTILAQSAFDITYKDTCASLMMKGLNHLMKSFPLIVTDLEQKNEKTKKAAIHANSRKKVFSKSSIGAISLQDSAEDIEIYCRSLTFENNNNPIALPKIVLSEATIIIKQFKILETSSIEEPGTILLTDRDRLIVSTRTKNVEIIINNVHKKNDEKTFRLQLGMNLASNSSETTHLDNLNHTLAGNEAFWLERLRNAHPILVPLPVSSGKSNGCKTARCTIDFPDLRQNPLKQLENKADQLLITVLSFLLRVTGQNRFTVKYKDTVISSFSNDYHIFSEYVPLEVQADPEKNIESFIDAVIPEVRKVREAITFQKDIFGRYPSLLSGISGMEDVSNIKISVIDNTGTAIVTEKDQFHFVINADDGSLELLYNQRAVKESLAKEIQLQLNAYLSCLAKNADRPINKMALVSDCEHQRILYKFNDTQFPYASDKTLSQYFEEAVIKHKSNVALSYGEESITYEDLNRRANQLAHQLVYDGLREEQPVAIIADRSFEMIISVIATLKAGGTYVPIDLSQPIQRMKQILNSVRASHVIVYQIEREVLSNLQTENNDIKFVYNLDGSDLQKANSFSTTITVDQINAQPYENLTPRANAEDVAYVIHTSGSTGTPKGVVVKHRPVINILEWVNTRYKVTSEDRLLFVTSISFDLSVYDIFGILGAGASLQIAKQSEIQDPKKLCEILNKYPITIWDSAPGTLQQIVPYLHQVTNRSQLRLAMLSGDWISLSLPPALKQHFENIHVLSMGGATEGTIWSNYFDIYELDSEWKSIPYGKPIQNCQYFIFDEYFNVSPINREGDLYIGGQCLAEGYLNKPELTNERFIPNPWLPGQIMYKTGDRARWMPDGNMEFLGRLDDQVKIRGFRIELGEIESHLLTHNCIQEAVVVAREKDGDKHLIAYCITRDGLQVSEIRDYLSDRLPEYMIPSYFFEIDEMPLTANGKVNKKALPEPEFHTSVDYQPPTNNLEQHLVDIWSDVLKINRSLISINRSFFELGGHSFRAITMINKLAESLSIEIPLREVFRHQDIKSLASFIKVNQIEILEDQNKIIEYTVSN